MAIVFVDGAFGVSKARPRCPRGVNSMATARRRAKGVVNRGRFGGVGQ